MLAVAGSGGGGATDPTAYRAAFLVAAVFALIGVLLALRVPDADAAETMQMRAKRSPVSDVRIAETG